MRFPLNAAAIALSAALLACTIGLAKDFELQYYSIMSNAPVEITVRTPERPENPHYRAADGSWKPLSVNQVEGGVVFTMPTDAGGSTVILLSKPQWLTLPDDEPPVLSAVALDSLRVTPDDKVMQVGRLPEPPAAITLTVADAANPLAAGSIRVLINDAPLERFGGSADFRSSANGRQADIVISPGTLPEGDYEVQVAVADAAPTANILVATITFSTSPLLRNGSFGELDEDGLPRHWTFASWHQPDHSEYDISIARGDGRAGNALKFVGIDGRINMVAGQPVDLVPGQTYVLSGYYKSDVNGGYASLRATAVGDATAQYDNTPRLTKADDWTPFSWELTAAEDNRNYVIYLRSTSTGTIYMDDINLKTKR